MSMGGLRGAGWIWSKPSPELPCIAGDWEGNCDACHLKMPWRVARVFRDHPERAQKWLDREARAGKTFRPRGPSIAQLVQLSRLPIVVESDEYEIKCTGCTD